MEIINGVKIVDLSLYLSKSKTLIISDVHIGYEEALNKRGVLIPRFNFEDQVKRLKSILNKTEPKTIVINGDLKHEFGKISEQEWHDVLKFLNMLLKDYEVVLIRGNHDTVLGPIAGKKNLNIVDYYVIDGILIAHGDKLIKLDETKEKVIEKKEVKTEINTIIIGHNHPAVVISDGTRKEKYKCYLVGKYEVKGIKKGKNSEKPKMSAKPKTLIVMPSFNLLTEGTSYNSSTNSPYIKDKKDFNVYVVGDKVYEFGRWGELNDN